MLGSHVPRHEVVSAAVEVDAHLTTNSAANRERQEAGVAALIALAVTGASAAPISASEVNSLFPDIGVEAEWRHNGDAPESVVFDAELSSWAKLRARFLTDHLLRNSLYLIVSYGVQAAFGAALWIIGAHLFSLRDVGEASSLFAATALIGQLSLLGLNTALLRYLPTAERRDELVTAVLLFVAICGAVMSAVYLLLIPVIAPRLMFIVHGPLLIAGFVLLTAGVGVNLLTDSVFIACRKSGYTALTDGVIGGTMRIGFTIALAGTGAYGLYSSNAGGFAVSAIASIGLMSMGLRWHPSLKQPLATIRPLLRFSGTNYLASLFYQAPTLVVPTIVLDRLGASDAAYYYIAFQLAALVHAAGHSVGFSILAEGSQADANSKTIRRRSLRVMLGLTIPATVGLVLVGHWVLIIFGRKYSEHGTVTLILLALAAIPLAANNWLTNILRLAGNMGAVVVSTGVYGVAISGLAWILAPYGLSALSMSWFIGATLAAVFAAVPVASTLRRSAHRGRHRRPHGRVFPAAK